MPDHLSILCVHGIGHGDIDADLEPSWRGAITKALQRWTPDLEVDLDFLRYDDLFDHAPLNPIVYGEAVARLMASGVFHGIGDLFSGTRGLFDIPDQIRWTAGMIAQWASEDRLRDRLRRRVLDACDATVRAMRPLAARPERRALLVGINAYPDPKNRLEGCVNDVFLMSSVLQECGFAPEEVRVVLDERATTSAILERFHWLLDEVPSGAERVLFYSGHGAQIPTYDLRGEVDHLDECLVPYDFDWSPAHAIRDNQFAELYSQLPYDSRFVAVFDCCHSGGLTREGGLRPRGIEPPDDVRHRALAWNVALQMWEERALRSPNRSLARSRVGAAYLGARGVTNRIGRGVGLRGLPDRTYNDQRRRLRHRGPYLPTIFEACQEQELSYEYRHGATSYGAFTYSLAQVLRQARSDGRDPTFEALSRLTAARLRALRYDQTPCLVGPRRVISQQIPWVRSVRRRRAASRARS
jgi:hypothetical protein